MSTAPAPAVMRERPILFSAGMVRAILAGSKTQTRRVVRLPTATEHPWRFVGYATYVGLACGATFSRANRIVMGTEVVTQFLEIPCPYGVPGDRLWVRETWGGYDLDGGTFLCKYRADGSHRRVHVDDWTPALKRAARLWGRNGGWMSPYFLARNLSRLTLELTAVRVQRLQEISAEDARAEGAPVGEMLPATVNGKPGRAMAMDPRVAFAWLWDSINLQRSYQDIKDAYAWASNPWVWALTFRRLA